MAHLWNIKDFKTDFKKHNKVDYTLFINNLQAINEKHLQNNNH